MENTLDTVRDQIRSVMHVIARALNRLTGGRVHPNMVTIIGLLMHLPIAYTIAYGKLELAAVLLVVFGLFDTLDGELARLQKRASAIGMLLDSVTDRMKEIILYSGITYALVTSGHEMYAVWAAVAVGASVLVSYINAWGEVVVTHNNAGGHQINKAFRGGFLRFEIRMFLLAVCLVFNILPAFVVIISILGWYTVAQRLLLIVRKLQ